MKKRIIHHHLGLGDHIICNGLVRYLIKNNPDTKFTLVCKQKNIDNVCRMFNDCDIQYILDNGTEATGNLGWSFGGDRTINFDEAFYKQADVDFYERWNSFYIKRDYSQEKRVSDYLQLPLKFALVHDTASAGPADIEVETELPIIKMRRTPVEETMFDWMEVIERASEIHCINSSFIHLVDSMSPIAKLYFYNDRPHLGFSTKSDWITVTPKTMENK